MEKRMVQEGGEGLSFFTWIKIVLVNLVITVGVLAVYHYKFAPPQIAVVDLKGYLAGLQNLYAEGKITSDEAKRRLNEAIDIIQREAHDSVVLSSDVVFGKNAKVKKVELPRLSDEAYKDYGEILRKFYQKKERY